MINAITVSLAAAVFFYFGFGLYFWSVGRVKPAFYVIGALFLMSTSRLLSFYGLINLELFSSSVQIIALILAGSTFVHFVLSKIKQRKIGQP